MTADSVLVLFPGALGDFICFLPTLLQLRDRHAGAMLVIAPPTSMELLHLTGVSTTSIHRREVADLFASTPLLAAETVQLLNGFTWAYSWTGFTDPSFSKRLARATGARVHVYPFRGMKPGEHAVDYYGRCAGVLPASSIAAALVKDTDWLTRFCAAHELGDRAPLVIHPGSGSPAKNWQGFEVVIRHWCARYDDAVVLLHGPAEVEAGFTTPSGALPVRGLALPQVAALLGSSGVYLGNDSGISHLANAVGARGAVLFGSTDPAAWAPRGGGLAVVSAPQPCTRCGVDAFCLHRLPAERVIRVLEARRGCR